MYKYIVLDLDGTLLDRKKRIGQLSINEIKKCKTKGQHVIIASGRHYSDIKKYAEELGLDASDWVICCDGQYIYNGTGQKKMQKTSLKREDVDFIVSHYNIKAFALFSEEKDYYYSDSFIDLLLRRLIVLAKRDGRTIICHTKKELPDNFEKMRVIRGDLPALELDTNYTVHRVFGDKIDITRKNVNKFSALVTLFDTMNESLNSIIYFGDDLNDIECFDNLKCCVAMGNAAEIIKEKAMYVTKSNVEDGVGVFLNMVSKEVEKRRNPTSLEEN